MTLCLKIVKGIAHSAIAPVIEQRCALERQGFLLEMPCGISAIGS